MATLKVIYKQDPYAETDQPKYHDDEAIDTVSNYCMNPKKTEDGLVGGFNVNICQAAYEMNKLSWAFGKDNGLRLRHWILSFNPQEARRYRTCMDNEMKKIAWYAAAYYGSDYQIVYAIHKNRQSTHIHFVMNTVSFHTGKKYNGSHEDYFNYLNYLSVFLREQYGMTLEVVPHR